MSAVERNREVRASSPDEDFGCGSDCRGILRGPSLLAWRLDLLGPQEQILEIPFVTREEPLRNMRTTRKFSPHRGLRPFSTVASQEKSHLPS